MDSETRELYERFTTGPRADPKAAFSLVDATGRLTGPPAVWLHNPELGRALEALGKSIRFAATLEPRAREIVILMIGHHHRSPFEVYAHERAGLAAGLTQADLEALAAGEAPTLNNAQERIVFDTTRRILATGTLSDDEYAQAEAALSTARLIELVTMIGFYTMVAIQLSVFGIHPPTG